MQIQPTGAVAQSASRAPEHTAVAAEQAAAALKSASAVSTADAVEQNGAVSPAPPLNDALKNINKSMQALGQNLEFSVDADTDRTIVKVIDQDTKEVIRQMPTAEALEIAKALDRVQGLLIRQKA
jgi:flagellar protein FlaG